MTLKELQVGKTATILSVGGNGALRQHFLDMGLIQGTEVTIVKYAPMGIRLRSGSMVMNLRSVWRMPDRLKLRRPMSHIIRRRKADNR